MGAIDTNGGARPFGSGGALTLADGAGAGRTPAPRGDGPGCGRRRPARRPHPPGLRGADDEQGTQVGGGVDLPVAPHEARPGGRALVAGGRPTQLTPTANAAQLEWARPSTTAPCGSSTPSPVASRWR